MAAVYAIPRTFTQSFAGCQAYEDILSKDKDLQMTGYLDLRRGLHSLRSPTPHWLGSQGADPDHIL